MPGHSTVISAAYAAARGNAAIIHRADRARILVSGKDRASYLHGLLTNDVQSLTTGRGCYAAYLTAQGRMISDLWVYELGDVILLSLGRDRAATVLEKLDQFVFSEDVQLGDVTDAFASVVLVGPGAAAIVDRALAFADPPGTIASLPEHGNLRGTFNGKAAIVLRVTDTGVPGYEVVVEADALAALTAALLEQGAVDSDPATAETLRIEAGVPKFHVDMDEETIPLEAGIEARAISLTKGCYVGQEVIIRVLHRGHGRVAEKLVGLRLSGTDVPVAGTAVTSDGREIGRVTSAAFSPTLDSPIALAYLKRDFIEPGTRVLVAASEAFVTLLPFV